MKASILLTVLTLSTGVVIADGMHDMTHGMDMSDMNMENTDMEMSEVDKFKGMNMDEMHKKMGDGSVDFESEDGKAIVDAHNKTHM